MNLSDLARQSPWWSRSEALAQDHTLQALADQPVRWMPRLFHRFRLDQDRIYTLRGPRQVGKTTLLKLLVQRLILEQHADPKAIFYYSCDLIRDAEDLDDLVETFLRWQEPFRLKRRYLLLDEVSSVEDWSIAVRALANRGLLRGCTVLLTGSHALDVVKQVERLPGRRGESAVARAEDPLDKVLLPMKFAEYAETLLPEVRSVFERNGLLDARTRLETFDAISRSVSSGPWSAVQLLQDRLGPLLRDYLLTGGFPRPINDLRKTQRIARETYDLYVRVLTGDLARWGHRERTAREILAAIVEKLGTPVSWRTLAEDVDAGSHNTVARYVESLERTFTLQAVFQYDPRRERPAPRKDRKVYVSDPFMFHAIRAWALGLGDPFEAAREVTEDPQARGTLLEALLADHLARLAFAARPTSIFDAYEHVMFWRSRKGWEVDFVVRVNGKPTALQVTTTRPRKETHRALRSFGGGIVLTESGDRGTVPLPAFLGII